MLHFQCRYACSIPAERKQFGSSVKKNLVEDKVFPLMYRFSSVGSSVGLLEEDDSPMSRVRAPQSVSYIFFMKPMFEFIKI